MPWLATTQQAGGGPVKGSRVRLNFVLLRPCPARVVLHQEKQLWCALSFDPSLETHAVVVVVAAAETMVVRVVVVVVVVVEVVAYAILPRRMLPWWVNHPVLLCHSGEQVTHWLGVLGQPT